MSTTHQPAGPIGADLLQLLKALKLGALADTLPERAALARQHKLSHIGFLETLLADEVSRRESRSAALRATKAGLDRACGSTPGPPTTTCAMTAPCSAT